jgi:hypothetical protein
VLTEKNAPDSASPCVLHACAGKKAYPASMVGAQAVAIAGGSQSDEIVRLYLED